MDLKAQEGLHEKKAASWQLFHVSLYKPSCLCCQIFLNVSLFFLL